MEFVIGVGIVVLLIVVLEPIERYLIEEHERGVLFKNGKFVELLESGKHRRYGRGYRLKTVDLRRRGVSVLGQELITSDGVGIKASLVLEFEVIDPLLTLSVAQDLQQSLYLSAQLAVRDVLGTKSLEEVMAERGDFGSALLERVVAPAAEVGVKVLRLEVKDIMLPNDLKRIYNQVAEAKQEALAELERARGQAAVTRNLLNTAKLYEEHPKLAQLRLLDAMDQGGNTIVVGADGGVAGVL